MPEPSGALASYTWTVLPGIELSAMRRIGVVDVACWLDELVEYQLRQ